MKEKYEDQIETLKQKAMSQLDLVQSLENLHLENSELRTAYNKILAENIALNIKCGTASGLKLQS